MKNSNFARGMAFFLAILMAAGTVFMVLSYILG